MNSGGKMQYIPLKVKSFNMLSTLTSIIITTFLDLFGMTPFWTCSAARPNPDRNGSEIFRQLFFSGGSDPGFGQFRIKGSEPRTKGDFKNSVPDPGP